MLKRILTLLILFFVTLLQVQAAEVEMADSLRESGKIYVVITVLSVIFLGIMIYLALLDRKVAKIEKEIKKEAE